MPKGPNFYWWVATLCALMALVLGTVSAILRQFFGADLPPAGETALLSLPVLYLLSRARRA